MRRRGRPAGQGGNATSRSASPWAEDALTAVRYIAAIFLGFLPRALWARLEESRIPVYLASVPSAVLELFAGAALGIPSFLVFAWRVANENTDLMLSAAARQQQTHAGPEVTGAMSVGPSAFSPFAFLFFTPVGLVSLYLASCGLVRIVAAIVDEPFGDPILTGLHHGYVAARRRRDASLSVSRRLSLEGALVPDRLLPGAAAGVTAAELVVIAARRKPGWEEGVIVVTGRGWFRIGRVFEEYHDGGLRTLYPLVRPPETEVMRRAVSYVLPGDEGAEADQKGAAGASPDVTVAGPESPEAP